VLRIDGACDPHAQKALAMYANSVEPDNPEFAAGIRVWLEETVKRLTDPPPDVPEATPITPDLPA